MKQVIKMNRIQIEQNPFDNIDTVMNKLYQAAQSNNNTVYFTKFKDVELDSSLTMDEVYKLVCGKSKHEVDVSILEGDLDNVIAHLQSEIDERNLKIFFINSIQIKLSSLTQEQIELFKKHYPLFTFEIAKTDVKFVKMYANLIDITSVLNERNISLAVERLRDLKLDKDELAELFKMMENIKAPCLLTLKERYVA